MRVASDDGLREFSIFMRQNTDFPENFSIGLEYLPRDEDRIILLRCNGPHGDHVNDFQNSNHHFNHHIHRASEMAIAKGWPAERFAEITEKYANYEGALRHFLDLINIEWDERQFPMLQQQQGNLFDNLQDDDQ